MLAGTAVYRRWLGSGREQLDVYFDDGSFVTFGPGSHEAQRLLPLARQVLILAGSVGGGAAEGGPAASREA